MNKPDLVQHWLKEVQKSSKHEADWRERAQKVIKRYRDEAEMNRSENSRFNILYSNTETLKGILYQRPPIPDVRRRYQSKDPVGRIAADLLDKCLTYAVDAYGFDNRLREAVNDEILPGRAVLRVKYSPQIEQAEREVEAEPVGYEDDGNPIYAEGAKQKDGKYYTSETYDALVYEEVKLEYVDWRWFRMGVAPRWSKVPWIAFGDLLTREELAKQFPDKHKKIKLDYYEDGETKDPEKTEKEGVKALVWTIWNKNDKTVYVVCAGYKDGPLAQIEDPLKLEGFFPMPEPLYSIRTTDTMIPVPEYCQYQDQAIELDELVARRRNLLAALKRRGVYDGSIPELEGLARLDDNKFVPITNFASLAEKGGLDNAFQEMDLQPTAAVIQVLGQEIENLKGTIYEVTGISDVLRGESEAEETATAQRIKAQYGNSRIAPRQGGIARFARDLLRLCAEIFSEHFSWETLSAMSGVELPSNEDKQIAIQQAMQGLQQAQIQAQQAQDPQQAQGMMQQAQAQIQQAQNQVTSDDVMALLRDEKLRGFRIDVETDSTIALSDEFEKRAAADMVQAVGGMANSVAPLLQAGVVGPDFIKEVTLWGLQKFGASKAIEEALEQSQPPQGDKSAEMEAENERAKLEMEMQKAQADVETQRAKLAIEQEKVKIDQAKAQAEIDKTQAEQNMARQQMDLEKFRFGLDRQRMAIEAAQTNPDFQNMMEQYGSGRNLEREESQAAQQALQEQIMQIQSTFQGDERFAAILEAIQSNQNAATQQTSQLAQLLTQTTQAQIQAMQAANQQTAEMVAGILNQLKAPKKVVRDKDGKVTGVETTNDG